MSYQFAIFSKSEGVAELALNKPDAYNAVNLAMLNELTDAVNRCYADEEIRALILTGTGRAFSAGGDVKEMHDLLDGDRTTFFRSLVLPLNGLITSLRRLPKPVIAAVNGVAAGAGIGLALACDFAIASDKARFMAAHTGIGLSPDSGITYLLPRAVGLRKAIEMTMTNSMVDANQALELGMINRVVPQEELMREARALATTLAKGATQAFGRTKLLLYHGVGETLEAQLELERQSIAEASTSHDFEEGVRAFVEKRTPVFRGR